MSTLKLFVFQAGEYKKVENPEELREIMATFYNLPAFSGSVSDEVVFSTPYHDGFGFGKADRLTIFSGCNALILNIS